MLKKNVTFNSQMKLDDGSTIQVSNPFEICHGAICNDSVATYDFEKG